MSDSSTPALDAWSQEDERDLAKFAAVESFNAGHKTGDFASKLARLVLSQRSEIERLRGEREAEGARQKFNPIRPASEIVEAEDF